MVEIAKENNKKIIPPQILESLLTESNPDSAAKLLESYAKKNGFY